MFLCLLVMAVFRSWMKFRVLLFSFYCTALGIQLLVLHFASYSLKIMVYSAGSLQVRDCKC